MILAGFLLGALVARLVGEGGGVHPNDRKRRRGWGALADARRASLLSGKRCVTGAFGDSHFGRLVTTQDLRPTLLTDGAGARPKPVGAAPRHTCPQPPSIKASRKPGRSKASLPPPFVFAGLANLGQDTALCAINP